MVHKNYKKKYTMTHISTYIVKSPKTGMLSYRRRIPADVVPYYGKLEEKLSLKTKLKPKALLFAARVNEQVETAIKIARSASGKDVSPDTVKQSQVLMEANRRAIAFGVHPDDGPILRAGASEEEKGKFKAAEAEYLQRRQEFLDAASEDLIDEGRRQRDYVSGEWSKKGYQIPYLRPDPAKVEDATLLVANGKLNTNLEPTLADALQVHLNISLGERERNELKKKRVRQAKERAVTGFAAHIGHGSLEAGMATRLVDISRIDARSYYDLQVSKNKAATVGRKFGDLQSVYNKGMLEYELVGTKADPFAGIRNKRLEARTSCDRRSFKPSELIEYKANIMTRNEQLKIIGLLMVETGCRIEEAAGLLVEDVDLSSNIPHIKIRNNTLRGLDKKGLERSCALVGDALTALQSYTLPENRKSPLFPRYGKPSGATNVSAALNKVIRKSLKISDKSLVAYSTRHTFADRCRAAGVDEVHQQVLMGHRSRFSTPIADRYGTNYPPDILLKAMVDQHQVKEWGDFN
jgi:integrase